MSNSFKSFGIGSIDATFVPLYTAPAGAQATAIGLSICNTIASPITVSVTLNKDGNSFYLIKNAPVPVGSSIVIIGGDQKVVLESGESINVASSASNSADAVISILEIA